GEALVGVCGGCVGRQTLGSYGVVAAAPAKVPDEVRGGRRVEWRPVDDLAAERLSGFVMPDAEGAAEIGDGRLGCPGGGDPRADRVAAVDELADAFLVCGIAHERENRRRCAPDASRRMVGGVSQRDAPRFLLQGSRIALVEHVEVAGDI